MRTVQTRVSDRGMVSRRRMIGTLGVGGAAFTGGVLAACSSSNNNAPAAAPTRAATSATVPPAATAAATVAATRVSTPAAATAAASAAAAPKRGGVMQYSAGAPPTTSLDPALAITDGYRIWPFISDNFVHADTHTIEPLQPGLVASWEQVDKSTLTLKVRQGVKWHAAGKVTSGRPFVASDLAYNLLRHAGKLPGDEKRKALFQRATYLFGMDKATAADNATVQVAFTAPNSVFLNGLGDWRILAMAQENVDKDPDFKDPQGFTGTGPFILDHWDTASGTGKYVANPDYWKTGRPYLDGVQTVTTSDPSATIAAFLAGKLDYIPVNGDDARATIAKSRPEAKVISYEGSVWDYFVLNQARDPFKDARVRRAIFLALNYGEMMDNYYGKGFWDYTGLLTSGYPGTWSAAEVGKMPGWNPASKAQDIADAKKLMEAAGFPEGKISFNVLQSGPTGQYYEDTVRMKDQLEKVWPAIKITLQVPADGAAFQRSLGMGDFDATAFGASPGASVVNQAQEYRSGGGRNYAKYADDQTDNLFDTAYAEFDATARSKLVGQIQQRLLDQLPRLPIGKWRQVLVRQTRMQGLEPIVGVGTHQAAHDAAFFASELWIA